MHVRDLATMLFVNRVKTMPPEDARERAAAIATWAADMASKATAVFELIDFGSGEQPEGEETSSVVEGESTE